MRSLIAFAFLLSGCLQPDTVSCGGGAECPAEMVCTVGGCTTPGNVAACAGLSEGAGCTTDMGAEGVCLGGACQLAAWNATALIGANVLSNSALGLVPYGVAVDGFGNLYIADQANSRVLRVDATGAITTVASNRDLATDAELASVTGVAVDGVGNLFIVDQRNARVERVDPSGQITTVAGLFRNEGSAGDGGLANEAQLSAPSGIAVDGLGQLFIADTTNHRIRRIDTFGIISTVAGNGTADYKGDGGLATDAEIDLPGGVAVDHAGNLLIADTGNNCIRRVDANTGMISTIAGTGVDGYSGDGGLATLARLLQPTSVSADAAGNVFIADTQNLRVRRVDVVTGLITTFAGNGHEGYGGDGGLATDAPLSPYGIVIDPAGNLYVTDPTASRVRKVATTGVITSVAGDGDTDDGDGGAALAHSLSPGGVAIDAQGNVYITDTQASRIRKVDPDGVLTTIGGNGLQGYAGDGGAALAAELSSPRGIAVDGLGNLYIADELNFRIRRIDATGTITTVAGNGTSGSSGDGGPAIDAELTTPVAIAIDALGNLYIADEEANRIRKVDTAGVITTLAGTGAYGSGSVDGEATLSELAAPTGVAVDGNGNVYIADSQNYLIRRVDPGGMITTIAGDGSPGFVGDSGPAIDAEVSDAASVVVAPDGSLYIADVGNRRIRWIDTAGTITTVVGAMTPGYTGDGGPAMSAGLGFATAVSIDSHGQLYIIDGSIVRRVDGAGIITAIAGPLDPPGTGPLAQARLDDPTAFIITPGFTLFASESSATVERATATALDAVIGRYPQSQPTGAIARYRDGGFGAVSGLAYDADAGRIYLTESSQNRIDVVTINNPSDPTTWTIASLANAAATAGFADGDATTALFRGPTGLYIDTAAQNLYVADTGNHAIRVIDLAKARVTTVAGVGAKLGYFGDGGPATEALLYHPRAIALCNGDLLIADAGNNRVRRVAGGANGTISTVLGDGTAASSGEGAPSSTFPVNGPVGIACDALGDLFVTSTTSVRLLPANAGGAVDGNGAVQTIYGGQPRDTFPANVTGCLAGIVVIDATTVQVTDSCTGLLVQLVRGSGS